MLFFDICKYLGKKMLFTSFFPLSYKYTICQCSLFLCFLVLRHALSLVIFFVCFGSYRMCHSHRGLPYPVFVRYLAILYNKKSVKFTCSSRFSRASQSPYTVEKQPKSTPDMYNPTHPIMGRGAHVYIPSWTFIAVATTVYECCEDSEKSRSTFFISLDNSNDYHNKRLLCHRFFTLSVPALPF